MAISSNQIYDLIFQLFSFCCCCHIFCGCISVYFGYMYVDTYYCKERNKEVESLEWELLNICVRAVLQMILYLGDILCFALLWKL